MKKVLILIILIFLTGCEAEYTIDIDKELNFTEKISIVKPNTEYIDMKSEINDIIESVTGTASSYDEYFAKPIYGSEKSGYSLEYTDSYNTFRSTSKILTACYDEVRMTKENDLVTIQTIGNYRCSEYYNKNFLVKIKTEHDVVYTNSDYEEEGYYVWNIDPKAEKQKIYIEMNIVEVKPKEEESSFIMFIYLSFGILLSSILLYNFIRINNKRNNKL